MVCDTFFDGKKPVIGRFVKFTELLPCVKAKYVSESETSKLAATIFAEKLLTIFPTA